MIFLITVPASLTMSHYGIDYWGAHVLMVIAVAVFAFWVDRLVRDDQ